MYLFCFFAANLGALYSFTKYYLFVFVQYV